MADHKNVKQLFECAWAVHLVHSDGEVLGDVCFGEYNDPTGRRFVCTSPIVRIEDRDIYTRNSLYRCKTEIQTVTLDARCFVLLRKGYSPTEILVFTNSIH